MTLDNIQNYLQGIKTPFCVILVGTPLSGKDTFLSKLGIDNIEVISRDSIILESCPDMDYNKAWQNVNQKLVDKTLKTKVLQAVDKNKNVIINLTNLRKKGRRSFLLKFGVEYKKIAIILPILSIDEYERRNSYRTESEGKTISMKVIKDMIDGYESIDETEDFNKVINYKY